MSDVLPLTREEHVSLVLEAFHEAFPSTTILSHRLETGSMTSSVRIEYANGPTERAVNEWTNGFSTYTHNVDADYWTSCSFTYKGRSYRGGVKHIFVRRIYDRDFISPIALELVAEHGLTSITDRVPSDPYGANAYDLASRLIAETDLQNTLYQAPTKVMTFAELKRRLREGVSVGVVYHDDAGGPDRPGPVRPIGKVQSNAIAFEQTPGVKRGMSWLYWDRGARSVEILSERQFRTVDDYGKRRATYTILTTEERPPALG